jgi:pimeloyl-ACP methyl ester carboxylesterase
MFIEVDIDSGAGRTFLTLTEPGYDASWINEFGLTLPEKSRLISVTARGLNPFNWSKVLEELEELLLDRKVRAASYLAFGSTSTVVQALALKDPRRVRTAIFVDPETRPHPSYWLRLLDLLERKLPLGLPFRSKVEAFDAKPFLHRLRFPGLVLSSPGATQHQQEQALEMSKAMPTAWLKQLDRLDGKTLANIIVDFEKVPAKCPQKNR